SDPSRRTNYRPKPPCPSRSTYSHSPTTATRPLLWLTSLKGVAGEWSPFEEQHGFSIDGVDRETAVLPDGWRDRLVKVQNPNTVPPSGAPQYIGWCLDKEDLCVAKFYALREKDQNFAAALLDAGLVDAEVIAKRLGTVPNKHLPATERALGWLAART